MNYSTDRAIMKTEDDLLGRASFSKRLAEAISAYNSTDSLVIGLYGKWGTGKTSVANMTLQTIESAAQDDNSKPIIMRFSPWNYSDKDNLIRQFFTTLQSAINLSGNEKFKRIVGEAMANYADVFNIASTLPGIIPIIASALKEVTKNGGKQLSAPPELNDLKNKLSSVLTEADRKIIVVIDDIDRLTSSQIRDIFQLVKQVGDLPNIIYILIMDRDVVSNALSENHAFNGNEYLEKIIQIPFEIPELCREKLKAVFFKKLDNILNGLPQEITLDQKYWSRIFINCIDPYLHTLRDVNRLLNVFSFKYRYLYEETSFEDMAGLTAIEVFEPKLYRWIAENKDVVCGGLFHSMSHNQKSSEAYIALYKEKFGQLGINSDKALNCLSALFPVFAADTNAYLYNGHSSSNDRCYMRIADPKRFDLYFSLDPNSIEVSRSIINSCIVSFDKDQLIEVINSINHQNKIVFFLEELYSLLNQVPYSRIILLASVITELTHSFRDDKVASVIVGAAQFRAHTIVKNLVNMLNTDEEKYMFYRDMLQESNVYTLGFLAEEILVIGNGHGKYDSKTEDKSKQIISQSQLTELETLFLKKVKELFNSSNPVELTEFQYVLYLWKILDKETAEDYVQFLCKTDVNKLKFLCSLAIHWTGTGGQGWSYNPESYSEYFSTGEVMQLISNYDKNKLNSFTELEQIQLSSFFLNYADESSREVSESVATELVRKWKNQST